jgi:hypothetical protein
LVLKRNIKIYKEIFNVKIENKILVVKELPDGSPVRIPYFIASFFTGKDYFTVKLGNSTRTAP